jgi:hypothetical protein
MIISHRRSEDEKTFQELRRLKASPSLDAMRLFRTTYRLRFGGLNDNQLGIRR